MTTDWTPNPQRATNFVPEPETHIHRCPGLEWFNHPHAAQRIYTGGLGPAVHDPSDPDGERTIYAVELLEWAAVDGWDYVMAVTRE